jgi:hypothetical protein
MARIRYLNPEFFVDDDLKDLDFCARLFFTGLWCYADKAGRLVYKPEKLKVQIMPYDNIDVLAILQQLSKPKRSGVPFILIYGEPKNQYIQITGWEKYQHPHHTEKESTLPAPNTLKSTTKRKIKIKRKRSVHEASTRLENGYLTVKNSVTVNEIQNKDAKNGKLPQQKLMDDFKLLYEQETKMPFKWEAKDFIIATRLIAEFTYSVVVDKCRIMALLCKNKSAWFTKGGWADLSIGKVSTHWNEIIPEQLIDKKKLEQDKINREVSDHNARVNKILHPDRT